MTKKEELIKAINEESVVTQLDAKNAYIIQINVKHKAKDEIQKLCYFLKNQLALLGLERVLINAVFDDDENLMTFYEIKNSEIVEI